MADPAALDPRIAGVLKRPFAQQVAFFRGKLGNLIPTQRWTDVQRSGHDRGFMVAGAQTADLLAALAATVDRGITEGKSIDAFRADFSAIVKQTGWSYTGEFNWRTRTIYRTNMATSYAAGRNAQLREGGFPYLMYKHGGSAEPRLEHLAWDGIVLPADHPFWQTHFAPNGWGCSCRIVGLRSPDDARRLGGDPDKQLPEDWDSIDPKTGAPPGIDKGWDYRPGDTVVDAVAQMATKTQHWDYVLAKAYMQGVPEAQRDALAQAYRALPSVADDTRRYAQRIIEGRTHLDIPPYRTLGLVTTEQARRIGVALEREVSGFDFSIGRDAPLHIHNHHGNAAAETARGQRAVVAADYARLPLIVSQPDDIVPAGSSGVGHSIMRFIKEIDGESYTAAFELRTGRKTLALQSFWIGRP